MTSRYGVVMLLCEKRLVIRVILMFTHIPLLQKNKNKEDLDSSQLMVVRRKNKQKEIWWKENMISYA